MGLGGRTSAAACLSALAMLEARGVRCVCLMAQDVGRDERQLLCMPRKEGSGAGSADEALAWELGVAFPNVPYEEKKEQLFVTS